MDNNSKSLLAISFGAGFVAPNIPIATFHQGDKELNFILDTGSDDNVVDKEILQNTQYEPVEHEGKLYGAGEGLDVGACMITFQYEGETFTEKFLISDCVKKAFDAIRGCHCIQLHGLLGSKFLRNNNFVLDYNKLQAYNNKE